MKKIISPIIFGYLIFLFSTAQADIQAAEKVVMHTVDTVLERLSTEREAFDSDPKRIYDLVNEVIIPNFDFINMSRWVLGKEIWRAASATQQQQFVSEFRTLLIRTYVKTLLEYSTLLGYSNKAIEYLPVKENPDSNLTVVKTRMSKATGAVSVDYRMRINGGKWKIVDLVVDHVSLVKIYRGSFVSEIKKNGLDSTIKRLSERNADIINPPR